MSRIKIKYDPKEYWIDDDGYLAYGKGDDYDTVGDIYTDAHTQSITNIIESFPDLLEALKGLVEDDLYSSKYMDMALKAIAKAEAE